MFVDIQVPAGGGSPVFNASSGLTQVFETRQLFDPGIQRPYFDKYGRRSVTINTGRWTVEKGVRKAVREQVLISTLMDQGIYNPVFNATSLRKEEWLELDKTVLKAARLRMRAWSDLVGANSYGGFNAFGKSILEHETMSDPGEALVDMDALTDGRNDAPRFQLEGLPLPITHSDFWTSKRKRDISANTGMPIDVSMGEAAGRRVGEMIEKTTIGLETGMVYGGNSTQVGGYGRTSQVYGYLNFSPRLTYSGLTLPTGGSWTPDDLVSQMLAMRQALYNNKFFGPFMVYHSNDWDTYLDNDYYVSITSGAVAPSKTLRNRLREIDGIQDVRRLDFLAGSATAYASDAERITTANPYTMIMVQMTADVARGVDGMGITTVQWEDKGGFKLMFKVLAIQVPQLRADFNGRTGILTAVAA